MQENMRHFLQRNQWSSKVYAHSFFRWLQGLVASFESIYGESGSISEISECNYLLELVKGKRTDNIFDRLKMDIKKPNGFSGMQTYGKDISIHRINSVHDFYNKLSRDEEINFFAKFRVRFFKKIQDWILKSERIRKWILRFFTKQINPRCFGSWCVKGINRRIHFQTGSTGMSEIYRTEKFPEDANTISIFFSPIINSETSSYFFRSVI